MSNTHVPRFFDNEINPRIRITEHVRRERMVKLLPKENQRLHSLSKDYRNCYQTLRASHYPTNVNCLLPKESSRIRTKISHHSSQQGCQTRTLPCQYYPQEQQQEQQQEEQWVEHREQQQQQHEAYHCRHHEEK